MSNDYFEFKQFSICHAHCAMKVGTDGVLLGAWANGGRRILDVGTGSGLIAMFMAQRFPKAEVVAIDIDKAACLQARENITASVFKERIGVVETALQDFSDVKFDSIVCNPPFFNDSLVNVDYRKAIARHAVTLPFGDLFSNAARLLSDEGEFSVVIPYSLRREFDDEAAFAGLFPLRAYAVKTTFRKPPKRVLLSYGNHFMAEVDERSECMFEDGNVRSAWFDTLTHDFYLH